MKKFLIVALATIFASTGLISVFQPSNRDFVLEGLSEIRYNLFANKTDVYGASLMTGERETPYILDGEAETLEEFGILTVHFRVPTSNLLGVPTYAIVINGDEYEGELTKNSFNFTYNANIEKKLPDNSEVNLTIKWDELEETIQLIPLSINWETDWHQALEMALDGLGDDVIDTLITNGRLSSEIHVQIIGDPHCATGQYYWYVSIYNESGSVATVIIDPITKEILSKQIVLS
jgi:hypothetical protein